MAALALNLLGPPVVRSEGRELRLPWQKALALLFYLAAQPDRTFPRAQLATLLWGESPERDARNSLSTALSRLRQALPALPLLVEGDALAWQRSAGVALDTEEFLARSDRAAQPTLAGLESAAALWRGPFLDGFSLRDSEAFEDWLRGEQARWQQRWLDLLHRLIVQYQQAGEYEAAIRHARRALASDPLLERFHRAIMLLHAEAGDRAEALAQYRICRQVLQAELGVEPDPKTTALYEAIVKGQAVRRRGAAPADVVGPERQAGPAAAPARPGLALGALGIGAIAPPALPLVGRQPELEFLRGQLSTASGGQGRVVVVTGEAGIGKTRLIEEVLWRLAQPAAAPWAGGPWNVLVAHCYEAERGLPYRPVVELLSAALPHLDLDRLGVPDVWLAEVNRLLPDLAERRPDLPTPPRLDPQQEQRRLFEGVARFLAALVPPTLVVLDDLHWADAGTHQLLAYLVHHELARSILFLVTVRSEDLGEELERLLLRLEREGRLVRLKLDRLSRPATGELVCQLVSRDLEHLAERLHRETEGNPLFAVETIRSLLESGVLQVGLRAGSDVSHLVLPPTVQAVISSRLDRLDPGARELLNAASVFGGELEFDDAQAVSGLDEDAALDALDALLKAQLLREVVGPSVVAQAAGSGPAVSTAYRFSHDKIRQVVYESLSGARRRRFHRRALDLLTGRSAPPERLAYHAYRAQVWDHGLEWSEQAAAAAARVFAYAAATALYGQALDCLERLAGSAGGEASEELRRHDVDLRLRLAQVGFYVQPGQLVEWLAPAEAAAAGLGDERRLAEVLLAKASSLYIQGYFTAALPLFERLRPLAAVGGDEWLLARADDYLGRLLVIRGELRRGLETLERALPVLRRRASPIETATSLGLVVSAHALMGDFARAEAVAEELPRRVEGAGEAGAAPVDLYFSFYRALIAQTRGDWTRAAELGWQASARARAAGNVIYEYVSHVYLGLALARLGDLEGGVAVQEQALALAEQAQIRVLLGRAFGWLGEIYLLAGRPADARAAATRGRETAEQHGYRYERALCERVLGEVATAQGDWADAERLLGASVAEFERLEAEPELARAEAAQGRLARARGAPDEAAAAFARAAERFERCGMAWDLERVRQALRSGATR